MQIKQNVFQEISLIEHNIGQKFKSELKFDTKSSKITRIVSQYINQNAEQIYVRNSDNLKIHQSEADTEVIFRFCGSIHKISKLLLMEDQLMFGLSLFIYYKIMEAQKSVSLSNHPLIQMSYYYPFAQGQSQNHKSLVRYSKTYTSFDYYQIKQRVQQHQHITSGHLIRILQVVQQKTMSRFDIYFQYVPYNLRFFFKSFTMIQISKYKRDLLNLCSELISHNIYPEISQTNLGFDFAKNIKLYVTVDYNLLHKIDKNELLHIKQNEIDRILNQCESNIPEFIQPTIPPRLSYNDSKSQDDSRCVINFHYKSPQRRHRHFSTLLSTSQQAKIERNSQSNSKIERIVEYQKLFQNKNQSNIQSTNFIQNNKTVAMKPKTFDKYQNNYIITEGRKINNINNQIIIPVTRYISTQRVRQNLTKNQNRNLNQKPSVKYFGTNNAISKPIGTFIIDRAKTPQYMNCHRLDNQVMNFKKESYHCRKPSKQIMQLQQQQQHPQNLSNNNHIRFSVDMNINMNINNLEHEKKIFNDIPQSPPTLFFSSLNDGQQSLEKQLKRPNRHNYSQSNFSTNFISYGQNDYHINYSHNRQNSSNDQKILAKNQQNKNVMTNNYINIENYQQYQPTILFQSLVLQNNQKQEDIQCNDKKLKQEKIQNITFQQNNDFQIPSCQKNKLKKKNNIKKEAETKIQEQKKVKIGQNQKLKQIPIKQKFTKNQQLVKTFKKNKQIKKSSQKNPSASLKNQKKLTKCSTTKNLEKKTPEVIQQLTTPKDFYEIVKEPIKQVKNIQQIQNKKQEDMDAFIVQTLLQQSNIIQVPGTLHTSQFRSDATAIQNNNIICKQIDKQRKQSINKNLYNNDKENQKEIPQIVNNNQNLQEEQKIEVNNDEDDDKKSMISYRKPLSNSMQKKQSKNIKKKIQEQHTCQQNQHKQSGGCQSSCKLFDIYTRKKSKNSQMSQKLVSQESKQSKQEQNKQQRIPLIKEFNSLLHNYSNTKDSDKKILKKMKSSNNIEAQKSLSRSNEINERVREALKKSEATLVFFNNFKKAMNAGDHK